jgi:hypothetical protein
MGYGTGQRNMGALIAALGAATPETTFLFFALMQFPIYMMPLMIKPLAARFASPAGGIPGQSDAQGKGIQHQSRWIPFPVLQTAGNDTDGRIAPPACRQC